MEAVQNALHKEYNVLKHNLNDEVGEIDGYCCNLFD